MMSDETRPVQAKKAKSSFKMQRTKSSDSSTDSYKDESSMVSWFVDELSSHTFLGIVFVPGEGDKTVLEKLVKLSKLRAEIERYGGVVYAITSLRGRRVWRKVREKLGINIEFVIDVESGVAKYLTDMELIRIEVRREVVKSSDTASPSALTTTSHGCLFISNDGTILHSSSPIFCQNNTDGNNNCLTWEHFSPERTWKVIKLKLEGTSKETDEEEDDEEKNVTNNYLTVPEDKKHTRTDSKKKISKKDSSDVKKDNSYSSISSACSTASSSSASSTSSSNPHHTSSSQNSTKFSTTSILGHDDIASSSSAPSLSTSPSHLSNLTSSSSSPSLGRDRRGSLSSSSSSSSSRGSLVVRIKSLSVGEIFKKKGKDQK